MPETERSYPHFRIFPNHDENLGEQGCSPWTFHATTNLQFLSAEKRPRASFRLPFRLDTATFVSVIPEDWLAGRHKVAPFLRHISPSETSFQTAAGEGRGRMAPNVRVRFVDAPSSTYEFDFLVTSGLNNRDYGLLALRDVLRHFSIRSSGDLTLGAHGEPFSLPALVLVPWDSARLVQYHCPHCRLEVLGKPGLNFGCNDCNRPLVRSG